MKGFQSGKYTIIQPVNTNLTPKGYSSGVNMDELRTGNIEDQGTLLMISINDYFFWFNAVPAISDIVQNGLTGSYNINVPTVVTNNKAIFIPDKFIVLSYSGSKYGIKVSEGDIFPVRINLLVNGEPTGTTVAIIRKDGNIIYPDISVRSVSAISTTGLVNYTLN